MIRFAGVYPCVSTEDPEGPKCYFSISIIKEILNIKNLQGLQGHHEHTHDQTKNTAEDFLINFLPMYSGSSGT